MNRQAWKKSTGLARKTAAISVTLRRVKNASVTLVPISSRCSFWSATSGRVRKVKSSSEKT